MNEGQEVSGNAQETMCTKCGAAVWFMPNKGDAHARDRDGSPNPEGTFIATPCPECSEPILTPRLWFTTRSPEFPY